MPQILEVRFGSNPALTGTNASYLRYVLRWAEPAKPAVHLERPSASIPAAFGISAQIRPLLASNSATRHGNRPAPFMAKLDRFYPRLGKQHSCRWTIKASERRMTGKDCDEAAN